MLKFLSIIVIFLFFITAITPVQAACTEVFLKSDDGIKVAINQYKTSRREVLIMAPGWFMTKDSKSFLSMAEVFSKKMDVITMDFRGHGRSSGFYTFGAKEFNDLDAVVDYAKLRYEKVYLMGFSLGAATSTIYAADNTNIDKLILVSAPYSFETIENHMYKKEAWLPTLQKFEAKRWFSVRPSPIIQNKIRPIDVVGKVSAPTLFIAGSKDPTVYPWHTKALYSKSHTDKKLKIFENCYHAEDIFLQSKDEFMKECLDWLLN